MFRPILDVDKICSNDIGEFGDKLSIKARLYFNLPLKIKFLGITLTPLIPFLQDLTEAGGVDFDKPLQLAEIAFKETPAFFEARPLCVTPSASGWEAVRSIGCSG